MSTVHTKNLILNIPGNNLVVARVSKSNLHAAINPYLEVAETDLYRELVRVIREYLQADGTLILNLALVERFPSMFYSVLLMVRKLLRERGSRLILCGLRGDMDEVFTILGGYRIFEVKGTETEAARELSPQNWPARDVFSGVN
jgi:anti-anti-sigma regulatory factor